MSNGIRYADTSSLSRPLDMPLFVKRGLIVALVVAAIIGALMLYFICDNTVNAPARERAALEENVEREVPLDFPDLIMFMGMSDEDILITLQDTGALFYERAPLGTLSNGGFEIVKLPDDVPLEDAMTMYLSGVSSLSSADAVKLLNGSWDLSVNRDDETNMYASYADFTATSLENAVQAGIRNAGFDGEEIEESGTDDSGNTFAAGTVEAEEVTYSWRVSVLPLADIYSINGLPDNSYFVGVRLTAEAPFEEEE